CAFTAIPAFSESEPGQTGVSLLPFFGWLSSRFYDAGIAQVVLGQPLFTTIVPGACEQRNFACRDATSCNFGPCTGTTCTRPPPGSAGGALVCEIDADCDFGACVLNPAPPDN